MARTDRGRHRGRVTLGLLAGVVLVGGLVFLGSRSTLVSHLAPGPLAAPAPAATVSLDFVPSAVNLAPKPVIPISVSNGRLVSVTVLGSGSEPVAGQLTASGWTPTAPLAWASPYQMRVVVANTSGHKEVIQRSFATMRRPLPPLQLSTTVSPSNGQGVGEGAVVVLDFSTPIPASLQPVVQGDVSVQMSRPQPGKFRWFTASELHWRPQHFWPVGEKVTVSAHFNGLRLAGHRLENSNFISSFTVVDNHITYVNALTHMALVYSNGKLIRREPVSLGRPGFPTISGTLVVLYKAPSVFMNSATIGYPGLYAENVYNDVAISTDGYFMHAANWDIYDHGVANVSFGCIEQNPSDSVWFYNFSRPGDIIVVQHTGLAAGAINGEADWNIPWSQY